MIKLIATDLDGTLLTDDKRITKENILCLNECIKENILISYVSGRPLISMKPVLSQFKPNGPIICYNGAKIYYNDEVIYHDVLDSNVVKTIFTEFNKYTLIIWSNDKIYTNRINDKVLKYCSVSKLSPIEVEDINTICNVVDKILIYEDNNTLNNIKNKYYGKLLCNMCFSALEFLELFSINSSKGKAISIIMNKLSIKNDEVIAFGDNDNDISMFDNIKYSVSMANATSICKEKTNYITESNNDSGVSKFIKKIKKGL